MIIKPSHLRGLLVCIGWRCWGPHWYLASVLLPHKILSPYRRPVWRTLVPSVSPPVVFVKWENYISVIHLPSDTHQGGLRNKPVVIHPEVEEDYIFFHPRHIWSCFCLLYRQLLAQWKFSHNFPSLRSYNNTTRTSSFGSLGCAYVSTCLWFHSCRERYFDTNNNNRAASLFVSE